MKNDLNALGPTAPAVTMSARPGSTPDPSGPPGGHVDLGASSETPPPSREDALVGKTVDGRYVVDSVLGEGGMGVVYLARHKMIDKRVAIKVLRGEMAKDKEITERFLNEARAASSIGNPHIIDISDFGLLPDGSTYFVMEYLDGESLHAALESERSAGAMSLKRLVSIAKQIARGLSAAHAVGIVHRDLKPDNVMLISRGVEKDFVKILDFGIAKVDAAKSRITRAGSVFGTPHYMSPEQAAGSPVDARTDVYALGVILYEMAAGRVPFDADNFMGILSQHMYKAPTPVLALTPAPDVPPGLDAVIMKCLSKKAELRYASMDALAADLERVEAGQAPEALAEMMARSGGFHVPEDYFKTTKPPGAEKKSRGMMIGIVAVVGAIGVAGFVLALVPSSKVAMPPAAIVAPVAVVPDVAPSSSAAPPPKPATKQVLFTVVPMDATVTRDGKDLGAVPIALELADGETASLVVSRKGYKTQTIAIDASEPRKMVKLVSAAKGAPKPAAAPQGNISEFQDPFLKK